MCICASIHLFAVKFFTLDDSALFVLTRVQHNAVPQSPMSSPAYSHLSRPHHLNISTSTNSLQNMSSGSNTMRPPPSPLSRSNMSVHFGLHNQSVLSAIGTPRPRPGVGSGRAVGSPSVSRNKWNSGTVDDSNTKSVSGLSLLEI